MRCTLCDRPAIPQAVGYTPEGRIVFGWCTRCLEENGCFDIVIARASSTARKGSTKLVLTSVRRRQRPKPWRETREESNRLRDDGRRVLASIALVLALWGLVLLVVGIGLLSREPLPSRSAGHAPAALIGGGGTTVALGLSLWAWLTGRRILESPWSLKVVQLVGFLLALATFSFGILLHSARRDPLIVGFASSWLTLSFAARWIELRRGRREPTGTGRPH